MNLSLFKTLEKAIGLQRPQDLDANLIGIRLEVNGAELTYTWNRVKMSDDLETLQCWSDCGRVLSIFPVAKIERVALVAFASAELQTGLSTLVMCGGRA